MIAWRSKEKLQVGDILYLMVVYDRTGIPSPLYVLVEVLTLHREKGEFGEVKPIDNVEVCPVAGDSHIIWVDPKHLLSKTEI